MPLVTIADGLEDYNWTIPFRPHESYNIFPSDIAIDNFLYLVGEYCMKKTKFYSVKLGIRHDRIILSNIEMDKVVLEGTGWRDGDERFYRVERVDKDIKHKLPSAVQNALNKIEDKRLGLADYVHYYFHGF